MRPSAAFSEEALGEHHSAAESERRWHREQGSSKVGTGGELRAGSAGIEGILPSFEGGTPSIPGDSRRARDQYGETRTPDGDF